MNSYAGRRSLSLDSQKRLAIPARYRGLLETESQNELVVTLGIDTSTPFLELYPIPTWGIKLQKLNELPNNNRQTSIIKRRIIGHSEPLTIDKNSRVLIPQDLRNLANIDKQVVLSGVGDKFELWDEQTWNDVTNKQLEEIDFTSLPDF